MTTVQPDEVQHNVTYRARVDGLARGALITYRISDTQVNSADPTMLPGRTFEATAVLTDPEEAGHADLHPVAVFGQPALRDPGG